MSYPKWVSRGYGLGDILCTNAEDEAAVVAERAEREKPADDDENGDGETVESLRAELDALGITYHHMAGVKKLKSLLPKE